MSPYSWPWDKCVPIMMLCCSGDSASHIVRDEVLTFQPGERTRTIPITLVDDDIVGEDIEIFNVRLTALPGQPVATAVQDGLAQVIVFDDESMCQNRVD